MGNKKENISNKNGNGVYIETVIPTSIETLPLQKLVKFITALDTGDSLLMLLCIRQYML